MEEPESFLPFTKKGQEVVLEFQAMNVGFDLRYLQLIVLQMREPWKPHIYEFSKFNFFVYGVFASAFS